eukprot:scaffold4.g5022.t1
MSEPQPQAGGYVAALVSLAALSAPARQRGEACVGAALAVLALAARRLSDVLLNLLAYFNAAYLSMRYFTGPTCWLLFAWVFWSQPILRLPLLAYHACIVSPPGRAAIGRSCVPWLMRNSPVYTGMARWFPGSRIVRTAPLDPSRRYVLVGHPHGLLGNAYFLAFLTDLLGFSRLFPGIRLSVGVLGLNLRVSFCREICLLHGLCDVDRPTLRARLGAGPGSAVFLAVGGAKEALLTERGRMDLVLKRRKGFVKLALEAGADLVPVLAFGENDLFERVHRPPGSFGKRLEAATKKICGFTLPQGRGRGLLNMRSGPLPQRLPLVVVTGAPIRLPPFSGGDLACDLDSEDGRALVEACHARYCEALLALYNAHKEELAPDRVADMQLVEPINCLDTSEAAVRSEDYAHTTSAALVGGSGDGRPAVALRPTRVSAEVQEALGGLRPSGSSPPQLAAAVKLALLLSRPFDRVRILAFCGGRPALSGADVADLRSRLAAAAEAEAAGQGPRVRLDIAVLCRREELGEDVLTLLHQLHSAGGPFGEPASVASTPRASPGGSPAHGTPRGSLDNGGAATLSPRPGSPRASPGGSSPGRSRHGSPLAEAPASLPACRADDDCGACRVVFVSPAAGALDLWQQLEGAQELLASPRASRRAARASFDGGDDAGGGARRRLALPAAAAAPAPADPLRAPRVPLLAVPSGLQQAASCRHDSLDWLGHLSSDGMLRSWLPNYETLASRARGRAGGAGGLGAALGGLAAGGGAGAGDSCFVQIQPIPKHRTLVSVAAGLMHASSAGGGASGGAGGSGGASGSAGGSAGGGAGGSASGSTELLCGLEALSLGGPLPGGVPAGGGGARGPPAAAFAPDHRRGRLRLLQALKDLSLLKLVWSPEEEESASPAAAPAPAELPPLDMFPPAAGAAGARRGAAVPPPLALRAAAGAGPGASPSLLGYLALPALEAAAAARGPLTYQGCEHWEAGAAHEVEVPLSSGSVSLEAVALLNGSQVLVVSTARGGGGGGGAPSGRAGAGGRTPQEQQHAAFYLQQRWQPAACVHPPARPCAPARVPAPPPSPARAAAPDSPRPGAPAAAAAAGEGRAGAAGLAAAVRRLLARPPPVDVAKLRRDVKEGNIPITPVTVGPLPLSLVRDLCHARAEVMGQAGVENLDSPGPAGGAGAGAGGSGGAASRQRVATAAGGGSCDGPSSGDAAAAAGAGASSVAAAAAAKAAAFATMRTHTAAVTSLLRQQLQQPGSLACAPRGAQAGMGSSEAPGSSAAPPPTGAGGGGAAAAGPGGLGVAAPAGARSARSPAPLPPAGAGTAGAEAAASWRGGGDSPRAPTPYGTPHLQVLHLHRRPMFHSGELCATGGGDEEGGAERGGGAGAPPPPAAAAAAAGAGGAGGEPPRSADAAGDDVLFD